MPRIHLIERNGFIKLIRPKSMEFESGYWAVTEETAGSLVGADILFHKRRADPAFFGGLIHSFRVQDDGEWKGRIVFGFTADPERLRGVTEDPACWQMEKKIVR